MRIRKQQMQSLDQAELRRFEEYVLSSLRRHWAAKVAARGEADVRASIQHGIQTAASYGIESERDVFIYINLMYLYGDDFDRDAGQAWAGGILNDPALAPEAKIAQLVRETEKKRQEALGQ